MYATPRPVAKTQIVISCRSRRAVEALTTRTMLTTAIQSMQVDSLFARKYDEGIPKTDYWKWTLEDGIRLIAKLPVIAAGIYRIRFSKGDRIAPDNSLDWAENFAHMMGIENDDFKKLKKFRVIPLQN